MDTHTNKSKTTIEVKSKTKFFVQAFAEEKQLHVLFVTSSECVLCRNNI